MECIWCKTFYESKEILPWTYRKCFVCWKQLTKPSENPFEDFFKWFQK
jgi:hypothetical protein